MTAQAVFSVEMFPVGVSLMEEPQILPAPQLVMLANVAAVTAPEAGGCDSSIADEKEMMELKTVGCSYSDSEDEGIIRYSYDNQNHTEVCIVEYPESPLHSIRAVVVGNNMVDEEDDGDEVAEDLSRPSEPCPPASPKTPQLGVKRKVTHAVVMDSGKKKKPFHCKPCNYQAQSEEEFVEHLGTHAISKMMVVNRVEGRSRTKTKEAGVSESHEPEGGAAESGGEAASADSKGVIRCERCGYNTNRYDHYIAHLKHHSKEGEDHRVFKCTLCPYTTVSQYHWRKHLRNHFPSKLHTCDQCCYFSDRKSNYIQHIRTHTGVRPFQCAYCNYSSSQKTHLTRHMRTHSGERPFKCESCNYLAANQHEVTRHARQVHNGPKPLACPYCEYKTADRSNFKKHVELHLNPRQFLCPLCKYAASKKCNLQYHIKSRHSGCDIAIDVSKVKLRVKKPGPENAGENTDSSASKFDESSSFDDDNGDDEEDNDGPESIDKQSSPINLSIKKSSKSSSAQPMESEVTEKAQKKCEVAPDKEKVPKVKDKVEKKVTTRQKKIDKDNDNVNKVAVAKVSQVQMVTPVASTDAKVKKRAKKQPGEKIPVQDQEERTEPVGKAQQENVGTERSEQDRPEEERAEKERQEEKERPEREKQLLKNDSTEKENKSHNKPRKTGSKKSEKVTEHVEETLQRPDSPAKTPKDKGSKTKAVKRKAAEALDLSTKASPDQIITTKAKRLKTKASDNKLQSKPSSSEEISETTEPRPAPQKDIETEETAPAPVKQKKTRNSNKKTSGIQETAAVVEDKTRCVSDKASSPVKNTQRPSPEPEEATSQQINPTENTEIEQEPAEKDLAQQSPPMDKTTPVTEKTSEKLTEEITRSPTYCSGEETPSPVEDHPPPTFAKPTSPPLVLSSQTAKPADPEDDEGIHSSHEGASDISDSASEGSDDSGLNGAGAGSGKMPNDPETPTDEIPTPTELKSHMCIFCDRTFPLEVEYRRHLNRHLVNVYYMDNTAKGQK